MANPGYGTFAQKTIAQDIVASGIPDTITITVDTLTRDGGTAGGGSATNLKPGLLLGRVTAAANYEDYDYNGADGTQLEERCVVLAQEIDDISTGDQQAVAFVNGHLDYRKIRFRTADDKTNFEIEKSKFSFSNYPTS